ncbi:MAG: ATP-binding protein, partial [Acidobacteriota bacterium]|nr:ATP-binding protein [Acidobacteriota bacterium]
RVPSLILQPLVENAIKHGITPKKKGGAILIRAAKTDENLILEICDTGAGVKNEELQIRRQNRIGLNNVEQRLHLYFKEAADFSIDSRAGTGTTVRITIDLSQVKQNSARQKIAA